MNPSATDFEANNKPVAILGYGNPSRGDDALGPEFLRLLELERQKGGVPGLFTGITDFQLQIEHALDLVNRELILFVDASTNASAPFEFSRLKASRDESYSSHAISPAAVLAVFEQIHNTPAPAAYLLAIRGDEFKLGSPIGTAAEANLKNAIAFSKKLLQQANHDSWERILSRQQQTSQETAG
ncbi:hydrogenase maturation protease [Candidatus Vondammii sp. HM_W22]|uniref:hydrogenase maturation protease n=1 Tax=Candidatus Vondammii sp. HM_W22 TaxID=2687299 RepID=UPI001F13C1F0|nr:hydrogenase maturation protease [Candidatus Vondammii sp. HM_W22]